MEYQPLIKTIAYNMLGSVEEAENVMQEVLLQWLKTDQSSIKDPKAYLAKITINFCIGMRKKLAKSREEHYPGNWLPEPVYTGGELPQSSFENRDLLSYELLYLMEKLNPQERAVFVLKEAFNFSHGEISEILELSEANCRKILSRARDQLKHQVTVEPTPDDREKAETFARLIQNGEVKKLAGLLIEDIYLVADGGGRVPAAKAVITGRDKISKLLSNFYRKAAFTPVFRSGWINHQPSVMVFNGSKLEVIFVLSRKEHYINGLHVVLNPVKLEALQKSLQKLSHFSPGIAL